GEMALTEQNRAKRFKLYKNGDTQFSGKEFVLNRRRIRTWDSFLQAVTTDTRCCQAVRSIRTPVGGTRIENLDQLQDKNNYVAVESGRFKRMGFVKICEMSIDVHYRDYEVHATLNNIYGTYIMLHL
ncbi:hypothetical protein CAPTEDRAFT_140251, partial [Capitella teleta]